MCDTFCVQTPAGMLFAKSSDRPLDEPQLLEWFGRSPGADAERRLTHVTIPDAPAAALLGSHPSWMWGLEHGLNEHGVAIGNEKIWTVDDPKAVPPALIGMDLVRLGLEVGISADSALDAVIDHLERHGQGGSGEEHADEPYWSSFLVVDARGGWVLETSGRSWVARPVTSGAAISNRVTLGTDWTRASDDVPPGSDWDARRAPDAPTGIADHRLAATRRCVALGPQATATDAVAALRDHGTGPWGAPGPHRRDPHPVPAEVGDDWSGVTVCMHIPGYQCTTASLVALLPEDGPRRAWASLGTPCTGIFLPVGLLDPPAPGAGSGTVGLGGMAVSGRAPSPRGGSARGGAPVPVVPEVLGEVDAWTLASALSRAVERPGDAGADALLTVRARFDVIEDEAWAIAEDLVDGDAGRDRWRIAAETWSDQVRAALAELAHRLTP